MKLLDSGRLHVRRGAPELAPLHSHEAPHWEFHYFIQGSGIFRQQGVDHSLTEGLCFLSAPGETHDILPAARSRLVFYWARFSALPDEERLLREVHLRGFGAQGVVLEGHDTYLFEEMLYKFHTKTPSLGRAADHLLHAFVETLSLPQARSPSRAPFPIQQALRLMEAKVGETFSLERFSRAVGWERSYFLRRFKKATGITPLTYFHRMKVARASFLLRATNMTIDEIAESLGFSDRFRFSKVFRRYARVPPVAFRKTRNQKPLPGRAGSARRLK